MTHLQLAWRSIILSLAVAVLGAGSPRLSGQTYGIYRELWTGLSTNDPNLTLLTNPTFNTNWPDHPHPAYTQVFTNLETEVNSGLTGYGQRLRTFIVPPMSGGYTFWIASDDLSTLSVSTDETPGRMKRAASVAKVTAPRQWDLASGQQSALISLVAGRRYYAEVVMRQARSNDNLSVRWQLPNGVFEEPMTTVSPAGTLLVPCTGTDTLPGVAVQPADAAVNEGEIASFFLLSTNQSPLGYQWQMNGTNLPGAAALLSIYSVTNAGVAAYDGARFQCVLSNGAGLATSAVATLTVIPDTTPPVLTLATNFSLTSVTIGFSKKVEPASATNANNYRIDGGILVNFAVLVDAQTVQLNVTPLLPNQTYTATVSGVRDQTYTGNLIAPNSEISFRAMEFNPIDIGNPVPPGGVFQVADGRDVSGGGAGIGGTSDQFQFNYQLRQGDFDVKVCVASLDTSDAWAKAGLMAREALKATNRFAAVFTTPSLAGSFFEARTAPQASSAISGTFRPVFPVWLRLQRTGNSFTGFAGLDGSNWVRLGSATLSVTNVYLGYAVTSHNTNQAATAQFRGLGSGAGGTVGLPVQMANEPLGLCSRRTGLVISEILYNPAGHPAYANSPEFIEVFNANTYWEDMSGYRIAGSVTYTFPTNTIIPSGGFLVVARNPSVVQNAYGIAGVLGPWDNAVTDGLPAQGGRVQLLSRMDAVLLDIGYSEADPWPAGADGSGHSMVLARPSYGESSPKAWARSDSVGGSPGRMEPSTQDPLRNVLINEWLANAGADVDYIELYNHGTAPMDISGCSLSDAPGTAKFVIPAGTVIDAEGYGVFYETELGFGLGASGGGIYFKNPSGTRVLDALKYEAQAEGRSTGRYPDGAADFYPLQTRTPGTNNSDLAISDIVINEIMYKPISLNTDDQYVELYNKGANAVDVGGWRFVAGINYTVPPNTILPADGYLVVARNVSRLLTNYPNLTSGNTVGDFGGTLAGGGERLALARPEQNITTDSHGLPKTNTLYVVMDEVTYDTGGRWGEWAHEGGSSLELTDPNSNHRQPANWADSDETQKAPWVNVEWTGVLDLGVGSFPADGVHLMLVGAGECLVDNIEVVNTNRVNMVTNGTFEANTTGWVWQGTHEQTSWETNEGYLSSRSLHIKATDRGDTGPNKVRTRLSTTVPVGSRATLRAKARWLKGFPELLVRLHGNYLEAVGHLAVPANLGTPGQRNSRAVPNAPPAIYEVAHAPILPVANQSVRVTARAHDADGLSSMVLKYRVDPTTTYARVTMTDDGAGSDLVAGDGIYSATIPGQAAGITVAFAIEAKDGHTPSATSLFPSDAPARECLVRFGETQPAGTMPVYRVWTTKAVADRWTAREKLNNSTLDSTFVYGDRRVVYNLNVSYKGSPFISPNYTGPTGVACGYAMDFPVDDLFLNATGLSIDFVARDPAGIREQISHWMLEQLNTPFNRRNFVRIVVNGVLRDSGSGSASITVYEDSQKPDGDYLKCFVPNDTNGELYKLDDGFEFNDAGDSFDRDNGDAASTIENFMSQGAKKVARYRWHWRGRGYHGTDSDYTNFFALVDAANIPVANSAYAAQMDGQLNVDESLRIWAVERITGNWDSYGYNRGKNMYAYRPESGKWMFMVWDIDFVLGAGGDGTTKEFFTGADPILVRFYTHPPFQRAQYRILQEAANGPLLAQNVNPVIDARFAALRENSIGATDDRVALKQWIQDRRTYILGQLNTVAANFNATGPTTLSGSNLVTLTGTAPVNVKTITVNGVEYPITWTTTTAWTLQLPLGLGTNQLIVQAYDAAGNATSNRTVTVKVSYPVSAPAPVGWVVFNELMFAPALPGAEYVELYNLNPTYTFDLSNWRLDGLGYTFAAGSFMRPRSCLVLAKDRTACSTAYGATVRVFDDYGGSLSAGGGVLALVMPGATPDQDVVVNQVRYGGALPWNPSAAGTGSSLQLLDAVQDNSRPCNWFSGYVPARYGDPVSYPGATNSGWRFVTTNATVGAVGRVLFSLDGPGDVYIDELSLVVVTNAGVNYIRNGDFEAPLIDDPSQTNSYVIGTNYAKSQISTEVKHGGNSSLHLVCTSSGTTTNKLVYQNLDPAPSSGTVCTLSFWYLVSSNAGSLSVRMQSSLLNVTTNVSPVITPPYYLPPPLLAGATNYLSPGVTNPVAVNLPAIPPLWLNEIQPQNLTGITNRAGEHAPWLELYNAGTNVVPLEALWLAISYTNLAEWKFPAASTINPGEFKVIFADGRPELSTALELHTSFQLDPNSGSVALSWVRNGKNEVLDYLDYGGILPDRSFGSYPDGQPFTRQEFFYTTPGRTNNPTAQPLQVFVNEWLASNTKTVLNPASDRYDDCFELYNAAGIPANLGGYYLTTDRANRFLFRIPDGYVIAPHGFLRVWADKLPQNNSPSDPDLHANFRLSKTGAAIGLFTPGGSQIDYVSYGPQTADVTLGRCPDGGGIVLLPTATLGGPNACPNASMPVITAVGDRTIYAGETLVVQVTASDPMSPPETLTFSLDPGAPAGAVIDPATGRLSWAALGVTAPSAHPVTVRVTDSATPPASATDSFSINVLPLPGFTSAVRAGTALTLTWPTMAGRTYRVMYKDNLDDPAWILYGADLPASGTSLSTTLNIATPAHRFFRIQPVP